MSSHNVDSHAALRVRLSSALQQLSVPRTPGIVDVLVTPC
jgi:hypothetical protein